MKTIGLLATLFLFPSYGAGTVLFVKGEAFINKEIAKKGSIVKDGDQLKTQSGSLLLAKFDEGSTIKMNEQSEVKVSLSQSKGKKSLFGLIRGTSFFKLDPSAKAKMGVKTKKASMAVRGTEFFVAIMEKDDFMCVKEGRVLVQDKNKKRVTVKEGQGVSIGSSVSKPSFLPWTANLNWKLNPKDKDLENSVRIEEQYKSPLEQDYD